MIIKIIAVNEIMQKRHNEDWGASFIVGEDLLFDTFGNPDVLMANLEKMQINLMQIKYVVISHEHWDHTDGLWKLLELNKHLRIFICRGFSSEIKERLRKYKADYREIDGPCEIVNEIYTTGQLEAIDSYKGIYEQSLVIETVKGISIITGCAHPGIVEIIKKAVYEYKKPMYSVIGGFHLKDKSKKYINNIIREFKELGVKKVGPAHCTGQEAEELFRNSYGSNFISVKAEQTIDI